MCVAASANKNAAIITTEDLRRIREETEKKPTRQAAMLVLGDVDRMKQAATIQTKEDKAAAKTLYAQQLDAQQAANRARKERMMKCDRERATKVPPTQGEVEQKQKDAGILSKAQMQLDEELDDVKQMNQMVLYSKVVTIRDKQIEENKLLEKEWVEEQKRLDLMMEIERLKGLQVAEEREKKRQQAQRKGATVIIDQIQEREQERVRQRELLVKEQEQMVRQIEEQKQKEIAQAEAKRQRNQRMIAEVEAANKVALAKKAEMRQQQLDEDMKIVRYN